MGVIALKRKTPYVSVNLTVPARAAIQQATLTASAAVGRRLSMSEVVRAAFALADQDQLTNALQRVRTDA